MRVVALWEAFYIENQHFDLNTLRVPRTRAHEKMVSTQLHFRTLFIFILVAYRFIGFGAIDVTKPYKFIGFGDIHGPKPYEFIGFGDIQGPKPYKSTGFGGPLPGKGPDGQLPLKIDCFGTVSARIRGGRTGRTP